MSNSAWSGNTSGLASATSPGLVGITTQTFAGKKTLDGGALIKGDTSGVAIASSYLGEMIGSNSAGTGGYFVTTNTTTIPTTVGASTLCSVTLNIGNYLCTFYCRTIGSTHQLFAGVNIGGTTALAAGGYNAVLSTYDAVFSVTLPIIITANSTAVIISGYYIGVAPTAAVNKIGALRIA